MLPRIHPLSRHQNNPLGFSFAISEEVKMNFLKTLGIGNKNYGAATGRNWDMDTSGEILTVVSPADGKTVASVYQSSPEGFEKVVYNMNCHHIF